MKNDLEQISNEKGDASTQRHRGDRCDSATADSGRPADRTFNDKVEPYGIVDSRGDARTRYRSPGPW